MIALLAFWAGLNQAQTLEERRSALYQHFGPKLIEAVVRVVRNEINVLRTEAGLPVRTHEQVVQAIETELNQIEDYEWMNGDM